MLADLKKAPDAVLASLGAVPQQFMIRLVGPSVPFHVILDLIPKKNPAECRTMCTFPSHWRILTALLLDDYRIHAAATAAPFDSSAAGHNALHMVLRRSLIAAAAKEVGLAHACSFVGYLRLFRSNLAEHHRRHYFLRGWPSAGCHHYDHLWPCGYESATLPAEFLRGHRATGQHRHRVPFVPRHCDGHTSKTDSAGQLRCGGPGR